MASFGLDTVRSTVDTAHAEYVDNTHWIRQARNAGRLRTDVNTVMAAIVRRATARGKVNGSEQVVAALTEADLDAAFAECKESAAFLFEEMPVVFARLFKNQLNVPLFFEMLDVLESIERGERDQNEGSEYVGKLLHRSFIGGSGGGGEDTVPTVHRVGGAAAAARRKKKNANKKKDLSPVAEGGAEEEDGVDGDEDGEAEAKPTLTWAEYCASRNRSVIHTLQQTQCRKDAGKSRLRAAIQQKQQERLGGRR